MRHRADHPARLPACLCQGHRNRVLVNVQTHKNLDILFHAGLHWLLTTPVSVCSSARSRAQPTMPETGPRGGEATMSLAGIAPPVDGVRVVDFNVKVRVKSDGTGVDIANVKMSMNPFDEIAG